MDKEVHSDLRLASLVQTLVEKNLLSVLDIKEEILLFLIDGELNRLDKWIDFNKKFATKKAQQNKDLNNADAMREQGFDERATHFFQESDSVLQITFALNNAKAMLQKPDNAGIVAQQHMEEGSQATFDWVIQKSEQLPARAVVGAINKILDIAPPGVISLDLLTSMIATLKELPMPSSEQLKQALQNKFQTRLNYLKGEKVLKLIDNDDSWAEVERENKYSEEQIVAVQNLLDSLNLTS